MPNYTVIVTREVTESCAMVLEGDDKDAVVIAALERAASDFDLVWEVDDNPPRDAYVTDVTAEDEDEDAACEDCGNTLNDGSDICDQCGGDFI